MEYTILFFANIKDLTGTSKTVLSLPVNSTVADFKKILCSSFPVIEGFIDNLLISVNQEFVFNEDIIPEKAEIAVFPPVSGGNDEVDILKITTEAIDINNLLTKVTLNTTGAAAIFTGIIRGETSRGNQFTTSSLEYEAYIPMAEKKLAQIADEIRKQWVSIERIVIVQRIGLMDAGVPTVVVICTAAHRDTGVFDAAKYGIDRLKEIVPIWKKEIGPDGETWIEGDYHPHKGD
ncbi:MAG: molybdopterin converting factor [Anaerolineaceae bacterium]|nr:molybdopterin converting factor [Anaerolineaceae bacterium]